MTDLFEGLNEVVVIMHGEPRGKGRPRFSRKTGVAFTPERTVRYEQRLAWYAQQAMRGREVFTGPVTLQIRIFMSIPTSKPKKWKAEALAGKVYPTGRPDWDNISKMTDACNRVVWVDDSQVVDATVQKRYSDTPRLELVVSEK